MRILDGSAHTTALLELLTDQFKLVGVFGNPLNHRYGFPASTLGFSVNAHHPIAGAGRSVCYTNAGCYRPLALRAETAEL